VNFRRLATAALITVVAAVFGRPTRQARPTAVQPAAAEQAPVVEAAPVVELAPLTADDIEGEVPSEAEIIEAAKRYEEARRQTNAAARAKRLAEKVLSRTPDGMYGALKVERRVSSRKVADLDAIRRIFAEHGLGEVPMKTCAPSLTFEWAAENEAAEPIAA